MDERRPADRRPRCRRVVHVRPPSRAAAGGLADHAGHHRRLLAQASRLLRAQSRTRRAALEAALRSLPRRTSDVSTVEGRNADMRSHMVDPRALALAANLVLDRLAVDGDSVFLVVANPELASIATELAVSARARTDQVAVQEFPPTRRDGDEPPVAVAAAMRASTAMALGT